MEHFSIDHLAVFLLAGFSSMDFFKRGLVRVQTTWCAKTHAQNLIYQRSRIKSKE